MGKRGNGRFSINEKIFEELFEMYKDIVDDIVQDFDDFSDFDISKDNFREALDKAVSRIERSSSVSRIVALLLKNLCETQIVFLRTQKVVDMRYRKLGYLAALVLVERVVIGTNLHPFLGNIYQKIRDYLLCREIDIEVLEIIFDLIFLMKDREKE